MKTHKDLIVWQKGIDLVTLVYRYTKSFPKEELFGLASQMRRASVSIPSNIAEGHGRGSDKELLRFLFIALGSASELETQLVIANNLEYITLKELEELITLNDEVRKMLASLIRSKNNGQI
ncbi:four helix bundle protein [Bacteroidales bacterium OttesenSCG-928-J19]|nr:four helix bundle protein [Bacteroidales bacterium OttesenSCG-928-J19]